MKFQVTFVFLRKFLNYLMNKYKKVINGFIRGLLILWFCYILPLGCRREEDSQLHIRAGFLTVALPVLELGESLNAEQNIKYHRQNHEQFISQNDKVLSSELFFKIYL